MSPENSVSGNRAVGTRQPVGFPQLYDASWRRFSRRWFAEAFSPMTYVRWVRWCWGRLRYGYGPQDRWNLDSYLSVVIAHALTRFRDNCSGYPGDLTADEWRAKLDTMIAGFDAHADIVEMRWPVPDDATEEESRAWVRESHAAWHAEREAVRRKGFAEFTEWFGHLWD